MRIKAPIIVLCTPLASGTAFADVVEQAAAAMCQCGVPPNSACVDEIGRQFPILTSDQSLQDEVMRRYQDDCVRGGGARAGGKTRLTGIESIPTDAATSLNGTVTSTADCATDLFSVQVPNGWACRKQTVNAADVTVYGYGNTLNVSLGLNQGLTSCAVIPICTSEDYLLSKLFVSKRFTNPIVGTHEYAGHYKANGTIKLTITSNSAPTQVQLDEIQAILDSFEAN